MPHFLVDIQTRHRQLKRTTYQSVKLGQMVEIVPEQPAGSRYRATVKVIDKVLDAASGTFGVRLELPNRHAQIPAGLRCKALFDQITDVLRPALPRR